MFAMLRYAIYMWYVCKAGYVCTYVVFDIYECELCLYEVLCVYACCFMEQVFFYIFYVLYVGYLCRYVGNVRTHVARVCMLCVCLCYVCMRCMRVCYVCM